jgi:hypothetical protein
MPVKCFSCGEELLQLSTKEARCKNADCPGGGRYIKCGFCGEYSFAVAKADSMRCLNPDCAVHDIVRIICPACMKAARVSRGDRDFCLNRNCPDNEGIAEKCFFCGNDSYLNREDLHFCTKAECPHILEEVITCDACGERSFVVKLSRCENPACGKAGE